MINEAIADENNREERYNSIKELLHCYCGHSGTYMINRWVSFYVIAWEKLRASQTEVV